MSTFKKSGLGAMLSVALVLGIAGCHENHNAAQAQTIDQFGQSSHASQNDQGDPAAANMAPANGAEASNNAEQQQPQTAPSSTDSAPAATPVGYSPVAQDQSAYDQGDYQGDYDATDEQPVYAPEPPPEMPEYDQPEAPGPDYIWTPGYWYWSPAGYYWVPGAWVLAPYVGALWTPGYWGFMGNRYLWNAGYWGPYVGFYGGINYGYGYYGTGYEGGYWNGGSFYYNRSINRIGRNIRHVYVRNISNNNRNRVSYNGGRGGLNARPNSSQLNAARSRRFGALSSQRQLVQQSRGNRAQFASVNKGRPAQGAWTRPVNGGRKAPAARPTDFRPSTGARPSTGTRPAEGAGTGNRPSNANRPNRQQQRPTQQARPTHQNRPEAGNRQQQVRPEARQQPRQETRPASEVRSSPQQRPAPQARREQQAGQETRQQPRQSRSASEVRSSSQQRPAPQARREQRGGDNRPN